MVSFFPPEDGVGVARRLRFVSLTLVLLLVGPLDAAARVSLVATLPDLAAIAREVGGDDAEVTSLAEPTEDPHYVDPRPSLMLPLSRADLVLVNGLDLEIGWLPKLLVGARNAKIQPGAQGYLDASAVVRRLEIPTGKLDRSMGDVHPGGNPHFLYDPRAAAAIARALGTRLAALDPPHAADHHRRAATFATACETYAAAQRTRFAALAADKRRVIVYHRSFPYLFDWLGLTDVTSIEPRPGISPSPGHVARVLETMRQEKITLIVQEEHYPRNASQTLAQLAKAKLMILPTGTRFSGGETYLAHIGHIAEDLYAALQ